MEVSNIELHLSDKQYMYDIFMNYMDNKFVNFEQSFKFLLNLNYYKKISINNNKLYDDKNLTNPLIIDNYIFFAHGTRSYHLYVGIKKEDDTLESITKLIEHPKFNISQLPTYISIYSFTPDGW